MVRSQNRRWFGRRQRPVVGPRHLRLQLLESREVPTVFLVLNTFDAGAGSLRQAILDANANPNVGGADVVEFDTSFTIGQETISLTSGQLSILEALTINGPTTTVAISGSGNNRVFDIDSAETVSFSNLIIRDGNVAGSNGGGIRSTNTNIELTNCQVVSNKTNAIGGLGGNGGGIYADLNKLTLTDCLLTMNQASENGGGICSSNCIGSFSHSSIGIDTENSNLATKHGGGIYHIGATLVVKENCLISSNVATLNGGGIALIESTATITDVTITGNIAHGNGGGVFSLESALSFGNVGSPNGQVDVTNNTAIDGGGVYLDVDGPLNVYGSTFKANSAINDGGGIYSHLATVHILQSTFDKDFAGDRGGAMCLSNGTATIDASSIVSNKSGGDGAGIAFDTGDLTISKCNVQDNQSQANGGGVFGDGTIVIENDTSITFNTAHSNGGGFYLNRGTLDAKDSSFDNNTAADSITTTAENGGGVYSLGDSISFSHCTVTTNTATTNGGGICLMSGQCDIVDSSILLNSAAGGRGGGIYGELPVTITNSLLAHNAALFGAGIGIATETGWLTMTKCLLEKHGFALEGGGVWLNDISSTKITSMVDCVFSDNPNQFGSAIAIRGKGRVEVTQCSIDTNPASQSAGALFIVGNEIGNELVSAEVTVRQTTMTGNSAVIEGGAVLLSNLGAKVVFENTTISGNEVANLASSGKGGGISISGTSAVPFGGVISFLNCTIVNNQGNNGGGIALNNIPDGLVHVDSTIVASNVANLSAFPSNFVPGIGQDIGNMSGGTFELDVDFSLIGIGDDGNVTFDLTTSDNLFGLFASPLDPDLGPLQHNGGPTRTHRPNFTSVIDHSPVIDAGRNTLNLTSDQRGKSFVREVGILNALDKRADIGSFELQYLRLSSIHSYAENAIGTFEDTHSRINSIVVTFDSSAAFLSMPTSAFELVQLYPGSGTVSLNVTIEEQSARLTFLSHTDAIDTFVFPSLEDGNYQLRVISSAFSDVNGLFDGNGDGIPGDDFSTPASGVDALYRLFGDHIANDRSVTAIDFSEFRIAYGSEGAVFDADGNGQVTSFDYTQFRLRYGVVLDTPPP